MTLFSRTDQSLIGRWWWTVDRGMLAMLLGIVTYGMVLVAAASPPVAERINVSEYHFIVRHLVYLVPALVCMIGLSFLSFQWIVRAALCLLGVSVLSMVMVLIFGLEVKGATRWLSVFGFSFQPSEFMKPAFIVTAAWLIAKQKEIPGFKGMRWAIGLFGGILCLLLLQPDLGMSVVASACFLGILFLAGMPFRIVFAMLGLAAGGIVAAYFGFSHVQSRIDRFLDPQSGDNYQVHNSLEAFRQGGLFGTGPGQGTVKLKLPDAHADFIFPVAGEELGLIFVLLLIALFCMIVVHGLNRILESDNLFVLLAVGGLLIQFGGQAFIHMGSALALLPAKGMTLPFISYGGSSLIAMGIAMGFVLALTRRQARAGIARGSLSLKPLRS